MTGQAEPLANSPPRSGIGRWLYALKPGSWAKLLVPMVFGQALAYAATGGWDPVAGLLAAAFTVCDLGFIVLINDWRDQSVDRLKRTMFPQGGSPKTIFDGVLPASRVGRVGSVLGLLAAAIAWLTEAATGMPWAFEIGLGAIGLFVMYSLPPIELNYRGGGELLEMLGVGVVLPLYNAYLQQGWLSPAWLSLLGGFALLSLASATASGLSDEQSDRAGGKRTVASVFGNPIARGVAELSVMAAMLSWVASAVWFDGTVSVFALLPGLAIVAWNLLAMRALSDDAQTGAFQRLGAYKRYLHRAIWHGTLLVAAGLIVQAWAT